MRLYVSLSVFAAVMVAAAFVVLVAAPGTPAKAAAIIPPRIAVVDVQILMTESRAAQDIERQLAERQNRFQEEIAAREDELRKVEQELSEVAPSLGADEFAERRDAFERRLLEARRLVQSRRSVLEQAQYDALLKLEREITAIVTALAERQQYDLVLTRQDVVIVRDDMDITSEVLGALNDKIGTIELKFEESP